MALTITTIDTGERLDISQATTIAQTMESLPLEAFEKRRKTYTNSIKLPATPNNKRILGLLDGRHDRNTRVNVFWEGNPILINAELTVTGGTNEEYSCQLWPEDSDVLDAVANLKVGDLYAKYNHEITVSVINNSQNSWKYQYYPLHTGIAAGLANEFTIDIRYLFPQIYLQGLMAEVNLWLVNNGFGQIKLASDIVRGLNYFTLVPGAAMPQSVGPLELVDRQPRADTLDYQLCGSVEIQKSGRYTVDLSEIRFKDGVKVNDKDRDLNPMPKLLINDEIESIDTTWISNRRDFDFKKGDVLTLWIKPYGSSRPAELSSLYLATVASASVTYNVYYRDFSVLFPDLTVKEVITDISQRFNAVFEFQRKDVLIKNTEPTGKAVDYSGRYCGGYSETYTVGSFKKTNYFRYKDDEKRHGAINILDAGTKGDTTVATAPYGALDRSFDGEIARYVIVKEEDGKIKETSSRPPAWAKILPVSAARYKWKLTDSRKTNYSVDMNTLRLYIDTPSYQEYIDRYFPELAKALRYPRLASFTLLLYPEEAKKTLPYKIWVEELNAFFYLMSVRNYIPGKPTKVTALRF